MKRFLYIFILMFSLSSGILMAQSLLLGPELGIKMGKNYAPEMIERENILKFNQMPDIGINAFWQFSDEYSSGIGAKLAYFSYSYSINTKSYGKFDFDYSYATLSPFVNIKNIILGFTFGIPLKGSVIGDIPSENLRFMSEFNFGYSIPLLKEFDSSLNLNIMAGVMLTNMFYDFPNNDPLRNTIPIIAPDIASDKFNHRAISIGIGLNYLFNVYSPSYEAEEDAVEY